MISNTLLNTGFEVLRKNLGDIETERFIALIIREPFNYTLWRRENLFKNMTIEQISEEAMELYNKTNK